MKTIIMKMKMKKKVKYPMVKSNQLDNKNNNKIKSKNKNLKSHHKLFSDLLMKKQQKCQKNKNKYQKLK